MSAEFSPCSRHCKAELRELVNGDDENKGCSGELSDAHARFVRAGDFFTSFAVFLHKLGGLGAGSRGGLEAQDLLSDAQSPPP